MSIEVDGQHGTTAITFNFGRETVITNQIPITIHFRTEDRKFAVYVYKAK